ncbi:response regulator [Nitratireductor basaltis]|uniref:Response regulator receiver protein n=1 Tax=Nitratireductor basaltis TaxID=472175 RepID=A0A084U7E6_9HYPH|nr:response regulator [Nitratireductor basaltis]KFB08882.1 Response regulator receiver protein [Nitratireductor basaltis]
MVKCSEVSHLVLAKDSVLNNPPLSGMRVLIVEEEAIVAMDIEELCKECGAEAVTIVTNRSHLTEDLLQPRPHVAILDTKMNGNSTHEFASLLHAASVPFVFASGYTADQAYFQEFPDSPVLEKPFANEHLLEVLVSLTAVRS